MSGLDWRALYIFSLLCIASWTDIRARKVPNLLWLGFIPGRFLSAPMTETVQAPDSLQPARSVLMMLVIALLLFGLGFFGGADMKAVISLSYVFPFQTRPALSPSPVPVWLPLSTLTNASLISTLVLLATRYHGKATKRCGEHLPFLPLITMGFIIALAVGDPFTMVVSQLLGTTLS